MPRDKQLSTVQIVGIVVLAIALMSGAYAAGMVTMWNARPAIERALAGLHTPATEPDSTASLNAPTYEREKLLDDIAILLERDYVEPDAIDETELLYGAARGMVASLGDPNTAFVEPISTSIIDEDMTGSFEGIGASVDMIDGQLVLAEIMPDSPAEASGLQANDIVLQVDDVPLEGKSVLESVALIRGPKGTVVRLLVQREGVDEPFVVPVTRDRVEFQTVETRMLDDGIAYLRLADFNAVAQKQVRQGLQDLMANAPRGLVLDLRGNPGGYLQAAVDIAGEFLPRGTLVLTEELRDDESIEYRVRRSGVALEVPLVVLVNGNSASASEIVAGAIQDHERGTLLGTQTYGKGSVQITHSLEDGSSLRVTVARWLLPDGFHLDGEGITPDEIVEITQEERKTGADPQLDRAIAFLSQQTAQQ